MDSKSQLTNEAGIPVGNNQNSLAAGSGGPDLLRAWQSSCRP
jgi:catalase